MGFFSSKQTSKSESTYENPLLKEYTEVYRGAAPWGFAALDPDAALAAMGSGSKVGGKDLGAAGKKDLQNMSAQEKAQEQAATDAMTRIQERQSSGKFLTPQETEFVNQQLDKAFESSRKIAFDDWTRGAQQLAGGRGLRMSDTPVADPSMRALRDMEMGFSSQRAQAGLETTLNLSARQQEFDKSLMDTMNSLQFNRWNTRQGFLFGGGLQAAGNLGFKTTSKNTMTQHMSGLQKVMGTMSMISQGLDLGKKIGGMAMSAGGMGGGADAFSSANTGGYPTSSSFYGPGN